MQSGIDELSEYVRDFQTAPSFEKMPRRSLLDKGVNGPTNAHIIEEIHTPFNFAYVTFTTGTSAFQNIVGVTLEEIPARVEVSRRALEMAGLKKGDALLVSYPPLVNVFSKKALEDYGLTWFFPEVSGRDALLLSLVRNRPRAVIGESSFLRACLADAKKLGIENELPKNLIVLAAGTPLDEELPEAVEKVVAGKTHDLYGCQEFGWLALDGIALRDDISLIENGDGYWDLAVGGLPAGDCFPLGSHRCNPEGKIVTYLRKRTRPEMEVTVLETTAAAAETVERLARTILRIKARIVRIDPNLRTGAEETVLSLAPFNRERSPCIINTKEKTMLFDILLQSQLMYQKQKKNDPSWLKTR
jgi:hypothetical protein